MLFHFGIFSAVNAKMSPTTRIEGPGGRGEGQRQEGRQQRQMPAGPEAGDMGLHGTGAEDQGRDGRHERSRDHDRRRVDGGEAIHPALDRRPALLGLGHDLDELVDAGYRALSLPGDAIEGETTPAKGLRSSILFSYLGVSGIFVPFTGEPSVNTLQPDVALPFVLAHEKAHQRGITHEGEANFAAFLVCSRVDAPTYLRYAAYLFATSYLLQEAARYLPPEDVAAAWEALGPGPRADLRAIAEFWKGYEGVASEAASQVNDGYLRALRVPEGVESYDAVVRMLLALDARGEL